MFYFFKANALGQAKVEERPAARSGKLFIVLLVLFHALFICFNLYYFMFKSNGSDAEIEEVPTESVESQL